jgi:hypothetical protein
MDGWMRSAPASGLFAQFLPYLESRFYPNEYNINLPKLVLNVIP